MQDQSNSNTLLDSPNASHASNGNGRVATERRLTLKDGIPGLNNGHAAEANNERTDLERLHDVKLEAAQDGRNGGYTGNANSKSQVNGNGKHIHGASAAHRGRAVSGPQGMVTPSMSGESGAASASSGASEGVSVSSSTSESATGSDHASRSSSNDAGSRSDLDEEDRVRSEEESDDEGPEEFPAPPLPQIYQHHTGTPPMFPPAPLGHQQHTYAPPVGAPMLPPPQPIARLPPIANIMWPMDVTSHALHYHYYPAGVAFYPVGIPMGVSGVPYPGTLNFGLHHSPQNAVVTSSPAPQTTTKPRKHTCPYKNCNRSFARASDQRRHIRSHEMPLLQCPFWSDETQCHRNKGAFNRLDVLKRHLFLVHYEKDKDKQSSGFCRHCKLKQSSVQEFIDHCNECAARSKPLDGPTRRPRRRKTEQKA